MHPKKYSRLVVCMAVLCLWAGDVLAEAPREQTLIDSGWRFYLGDPTDITNVAETNVTYYPEISNLEKLQASDVSGPASETNLMTLRPNPVSTHLGENVSFVQTNFDDSSWRLLNLPHDWVVELPFNSSADKGHGYKTGISGTTGLNTIAWYRRTFTMPASYTNETLSLEFDGVYRNCLVWLNGHILGRNVSGYSSFSFTNVTQYANSGGTNVLVVRVDASRFEGWFYEGAGIYRHVWLMATSPVHVAHWGTYVTNVVSGSNAVVTIQTQVNNDGTNSVACNLTSDIYDSSGNLVAAATGSVTIAGGTNQIATQTVTIANASLWSLDFPNLYQLVSTVTQGGVTNDIYQTPFGVRTVTWAPNNGLFLNGQRVEIQGMCNHQDFAGLGTALPDRIKYFRVEALKEMGCNVYRTSHNSPTPELLDACDQLGMLVLDENRRLGDDPETLGELQRGIQRDRNHPCVFAWSLANEETLQGSTTGAVIMATMQNLAHQLDPTRLCTAAMNNGWGSGFSTVIDVQGFNYLHQGNMDGFHTSFPALPAMGTEEGSCYYTRGVYTNTSTYKSAYDLNAPGYGTTAQQWWQYYTARVWNAGACDWTGFDYRGEPSPFGWPNISSEFGTIDTCGFPKDTFYYYQANWTGKKVLHLFPHWNWSSGQTISVWCFSDCDSVELFLNGVSQGRQTVNVQSHLQWNVPFAAGTLQAVGYVNGQAAMTNTEVTTGAPAGILLQPDRGTILADGQDVSIVTVAVVDSQGRIVPVATNTINFSISGGAIIGVGNGDPIDHEADKATNNVWLRSVFNGLAQVIVQSTNVAGSIVLTATATGLSSTNVTITAALNLPPPVPPTGLSAVASNALVSLTWSGVRGALSYNVKRTTASGGPCTTVSSNSPDSYYTDTAVNNGTTYFYVVSAVNANGESANSIEVSALPGVQPPSFTAQPVSVTNFIPMYAGVPITFSAAVSGSQPIFYQWYQSSGGGTNTITGATNASFTHLSQFSDTNGSTGFFVVISSSSGSVTSSVANLVLAGVVPGSPGAISVQFNITNYAGYSGGFSLAPTDTAGVYAASNWNAWAITPGSGSSGTQPGVILNHLADRFGVMTPVSVAVVNASDGWHQTQTITSTDTANARMMNTFWKANPNKSSPSTNILYITFTNVPNATYSAYVYLMQNTGSPTGCVCSASGPANYFREFIGFSSSSNFVTVIDTNGTANPFVNYLRLAGLSTGGTNLIKITAVWIGGADGVGVCGIQLIPPTVLVVQPRSNGQFGFQFPAPTNQTYVVETSTNLTSWIPVFTNSSTNGLFLFINTNATGPQRFYRVQQ